MDRIIREATSKDSKFLSQVVLQAGRSHTKKSIWDVSIEDTDENILKFIEQVTIVGDDHFCHHSKFHILEVGVLAVSAAASYFTSEKMMMNSGAALVEAAQRLSWSESKLKRLFEGMALWSKGVPEIQGDSFVIEWVATLPQYQRRGYAHDLVDLKLAQAKTHGFKSAYLHMQAGNKPAQSAYERKGFSVINSRENQEFSEVVGNSGLVLMKVEI